MSDTGYDYYGGDSGLKDDYGGVIVDAAYLSDPQFGNGQTFLELTILADDKEVVQNRYSTGPDWQSYDGGQTIEHPSKRRFNANTQVYEFFKRAIECSGNEDSVIRARGMASVRDDGEPHGPRDARQLVGLKFHWAIVEKPYSFKDRETGKQVEGTSYRPFPDMFLGVYEVQVRGEGELRDWTVKEISGPTTVAASASVPTQSPEPAPAAPDTSDTAQGGQATDAAAEGGQGASGGGGGDLDPVLSAKLKVLANAHPYEKFVDEALPLVMGNDTLIARLGDPDFYEGLKD